MQQLHKQIICLFALTFFSCTHVSAQISCLTPYNTYGRCLPYEECKFVQNLLDKYGTTLPQQFQDDIDNARCQKRLNSTNIYLCCDETISLADIPATVDSFALSLNASGLKLLNEQNCSRISNITDANSKTSRYVSLYEAPWLALLRYNITRRQFRCVGSVVTQRYILTAASCLRTYFKLIGVRLGEYNLATNKDCIDTDEGTVCASSVEHYGIERTIIHPDYGYISSQIDLGLIQVDRTIEYKPHIMPICLPTTEQLAELFRMSMEFSVVSWGLLDDVTPRILKKALVPIVKKKDCIAKYKGIVLPDFYICAGGNDESFGFSSDTGAPLYLSIRNNNASIRNVLFAVFSSGLGEFGYPNFYVNIVNYMTWITSNIL